MPSRKLKTKPESRIKGSGLRAQGSVKEGFVFGFEAIGTVWEIEVFGTHIANNELQKQIKARIEEFDKSYSRFRVDSLVTKMSKQVGEYVLPQDAKPMMDMYQDLYKMTGGLMTPLIGRALSDTGYDANYSFIPGKVNQVPNWEDCLEYNYPCLTIKKPVLLDFGALGKGYLIDIVSEILEDKCEGHIINAGGDILHHGQGAIEIALENPTNTKEAIGIATIKNQAICGSAGNRRAWAGYNHILSPKSLSSPNHLKAVWAVAENAMLADAMTTALYFMDPSKLLKRYTFSYGIINADNSLVYSSNFPANFFNESD